MRLMRRLVRWWRYGRHKKPMPFPLGVGSYGTTKLGGLLPDDEDGGVVLTQSINFQVAAADAASVERMLRSQKGKIAAIVGEAARDTEGD